MFTCPVEHEENRHAVPLNLNNNKDSAFDLDLSIDVGGYSVRPLKPELESIWKLLEVNSS